MGKVDWKEITEKGEEVGGGGYVKLVVGENIIRILSDVYERFTHRVKTDQGFKNISVEEKTKWNDKYPNRSYVAVVLDDKDGEIKILEKGISIFDQIASFASDTEYGDPKMYNIKINRVGTGMQDTKYTLVPSPKKEEITPEQKAKYDKFMETFDLERYCRVLTKDEIKEKLGVDQVDANANQDSADEPVDKDKQTTPTPDTAGEINLDDIPF